MRSNHSRILRIKSMLSILAVAFAAAFFLFSFQARAQIMVSDEDPVSLVSGGARLVAGLGVSVQPPPVEAFGVPVETFWTGKGEILGMGPFTIEVSASSEPLVLKAVFRPVGSVDEGGYGLGSGDGPGVPVEITFKGTAAILGAEMVLVESRQAVALVLSEGGPEGRLHSFWVDAKAGKLEVSEIAVLSPVRDSGAPVTGRAKIPPVPEGVLVFRNGAKTDKAGIAKAADSRSTEMTPADLELLMLDGGPYESSAPSMVSRMWVLKNEGWTPHEVPADLRGTPLSRLVRLGDEHFLRSDYPRAAVYYERAVKADPLAGRAPAIGGLAPSSETQGGQPTISDADIELLERACLYLGKSKERSLDLDGAILAYQAFIDRFPLSDLAGPTQDDASFLDDLRRAAPAEGRAFISARSAFEAKDYARALDFLAKVTAGAKTAAVPVLVCRSRYLSGLVRERQGDILEALADYRAAMNCPEDPSTSRQAVQAVNELEKQTD